MHFLLLLLALSADAAEMPKVNDPRLKLEVFAEAPDIVTPAGIAVDAKGRVLVVESHTHFPPKDYAGPKADRIRMFVDTNGDGKSDKVTNFFEGTRHTMNLAVYPERHGGRSLQEFDGSVFVATRAEIFRLRDKDGDGVAEERTPIAHLETAGDYPHNGLSGFAFDKAGNVYFGFGENLGADYKLIGSDGTSLSGGGEGGNIYCCGPNGEKLRRVATGFWNPFHLCFDSFGRLFAVDNDPDSRPPCRLLHIVEGGDYGYRFRNGRKGTHPFTAWNGELPGTLPMMAGTGEAPSGMLEYAQDNLPADYVGELLVTSWGDHRIERYRPEPRGASFTATMRPLVVGGENFRPVGIAAAPDGSLFISDWVDKSYQLHGKGRIWRLSAKDKKPGVPAKKVTPKSTPQPELARAELLRNTKDLYLADKLMKGLDDDDPFIRQAARRGIAGSGLIDSTVEFKEIKKPREREGTALVLRDSGDKQARGLIPRMLKDEDPNVRFIAVQWIGEEKLAVHREALEASLTQPNTTRQLFWASLAALERLDGTAGKAKEEAPGEEYVLKVLLDDRTPVPLRRLALRTLRSDHPKLTVAALAQVAEIDDSPLRIEMIRSLRESPQREKALVLRGLAAKGKTPAERAEATEGLSPEDSQQLEILMSLACDAPAIVSNEALRSLRGAPLDDRHRERLKAFAAKERTARPDVAELVALAISPAKPPERPALTDSATWLKELAGPADAAAGERIFFHPRAAGCYKCHQMDGRGAAIGPDLTSVGRALTRERLVESILQPSREIAPQFVSWAIVTTDGRTFTGQYIGEEVDGTLRYVDTTGKELRIKPNEIEERKPLRQSIMPEKLADTLTMQEMRDLLAYLQGSKPLGTE